MIMLTHVHAYPCVFVMSLCVCTFVRVCVCMYLCHHGWLCVVHHALGGGGLLHGRRCSSMLSIHQIA